MKNKNNCRKATFLIEKKELGRITIPENVILCFHLAGCPECRLYREQSRQINDIARELFSGAGMGITPLLDDQIKQQMRMAIRDRMDKIRKIIPKL